MNSDNLYLFSFIAGIFATFNPCGFAMLPAYLSLAILGAEGARSKRDAASGALKFATFMSSGVLLVFGVFALAIFPFTTAIQKYLPYVTVAVGIAILFFSVSSLTQKFSISMRRWGPNISPKQTPLTYFGYGITFALGSISCAIGPFLAVTGSAIATSNFLKIVFIFIAFGVGISTTIAILALITTISKQAVLNKIRNSTRKIEVVTGLLLLFVGSFLIYFGWYEISLQSKFPSSNAFIDGVFRVQGWIVNGVTNLLSSIGVLN